MKIPESTPALERLYAAAGRGLAVAVGFENTCYTVALFTGSLRQLGQHGPVIFEDPKSLRTVFNDLEGRTLGKRIATIFSDFPHGDLQKIVEEGRIARNELVHGLLDTHDVFIGDTVGHEVFYEKIKSLVTKISIADSIMVHFLSELSGGEISSGETLLEKAQTVVAWVVGSVPSNACTCADEESL